MVIAAVKYLNRFKFLKVQISAVRTSPDKISALSMALRYNYIMLLKYLVCGGQLGSN